MEHHVHIELGPLGTVHLNHGERGGNTFTQRALWLQNSPLGDVVVAEAVLHEGLLHPATSRLPSL